MSNEQLTSKRLEVGKKPEVTQSYNNSNKNKKVAVRTNEDERKEADLAANETHLARYWKDTK